MSAEVLVYHYDEVTGEHKGSSYAQPNPVRKDTVLVPRNATLIMPPKATDNTAAVFADGAWSLVADYRKTPYYNKSTQAEVHFRLGVVPTGAVTDKKPTDNDAVWDETTGGWAVPLGVAKRRQSTKIKAACAHAVNSGEIEYKGVHFRADQPSQNSIMFSVWRMEDGAEPPVAWVGIDGQLENPTIEDLHVLADKIRHYVELQFTREYGLLVRIDNAATVNEVESVTWE